MKQIDWQFVVVHMQTVLRVALEESTIVALIYDEIQRKSWSRRTAKGEVGLVLLTEAAVKSVQVVKTAKSKVKLVTKASGLSQTHGYYSHAASSDDMLGNAEAAISKQVAMAEQMTRKAEAAVKRSYGGADDELKKR